MRADRPFGTRPRPVWGLLLVLLTLALLAWLVATHLRRNEPGSSGLFGF